MPSGAERRSVRLRVGRARRHDVPTSGLIAGYLAACATSTRVRLVRLNDDADPAAMVEGPRPTARGFGANGRLPLAASSTRRCGAARTSR